MSFEPAKSFNPQDQLRFFAVESVSKLQITHGRLDSPTMMALHAIFCHSQLSLYFLSGNEIHCAVGTKYKTNPTQWPLLKDPTGRRYVTPLVGQITLCEDGFFVYCRGGYKVKFYGDLFIGEDKPITGTVTQGDVVHQIKQNMRQTHYAPSRLQKSACVQILGVPP